MQRHDRVGNLFVRRINILQPLNEQGTVTGHPVAHSLAEAVHTWPTDVIRLLAQGADANARVEGLPLLHYFCGLKKTHVIAALLAAGADPHALDDEGHNAFHATVAEAIESEWGDYVELSRDTIALFLAHGVDPRPALDATDAKGNRPLRYLVPSLEFLDCELRNESGETPFLNALSEGQSELALRLAAAGCDPLARDSEGGSLLHIMAYWGVGDMCLGEHWPKPLLDLGVGIPVDSVNKQGRTALHLACRDGRLRLVRSLLQMGASMTQADNEGFTALCHAVLGRNTEVAMLLLDHGAPIDGSPGRPPPLYVAMAAGYPLVARTLFERGANPNATAPNGDSPLHLAAKRCDSYDIDALLLHGADVNARDNAGCTPLQLAASATTVKEEFGVSQINEEDCAEALISLIEAGADPNLRDKAGLGAWELARRHNLATRLHILRSLGAAP
jgi:ankyrin repeat protein